MATAQALLSQVHLDNHQTKMTEQPLHSILSINGNVSVLAVHGSSNAATPKPFESVYCEINTNAT